MSGIQEDLFEIIQTLSVSEKRYFKVFASGSKQSNANNYVVLFDMLCDLDSYDESILLQKLRHKSKDIPNKNFAAQLNQDMQYLYKVLLQAMRQYKNKAVHIQIRDMLSEAILLRDRGLYKQADKRIGKAKELARKYHNDLALLEINRLERSLIWSLNDPNEERKIHSLVAEKDTIMEALKQEMDHEDLYALLSNAVNRQKAFNMQDEQTVDLVRKTETILFTEEPQQLSAFAELRRCQIGVLYSMAEGRNVAENSRDKIDQLLNWWEAHDYLKEEEFFRYQISLSFLLTFFFSRGELEEMMQLIEKIRERDSGKPLGEALIFRFTIIMHELLYYMNLGKLDEAKNLLPQIREGIGQYTHSVKRKITLCYNAALVCFFDGDQKGCEEWLLKVLAYSRHHQKKDLIRKAFLLRILSLEDRADDGQDKAINAAKKYFKEEEGRESVKGVLKNKPIEQEVLGLIIKIMHAPAIYRERSIHVQKLLNCLEESVAHPQKGRMDGLEEFMIWCQSKLGRKSIRQAFTDALPPKK